MEKIKKNKCKKTVIGNVIKSLLIGENRDTLSLDSFGN